MTHIDEVAALSSHQGGGWQGGREVSSGAANVVTRDLFEGLTFKVADENERQEALTLRSLIYSEELGNPGLDRFDDLARHLIAREKTGRIVAALRIVGPNQQPFDLEQVLDLSSLLPPGRRPAEVSRFCIDAQHRQIHRGQMVHLGMLKLVYEYSIRSGITDLLTLGLPHLKHLYRIGFFTPLGPTCNHPTWGPAHLMHLNLEEVRRRHAHSSSPIAQLLFQTHLPNIII